MEKEKEIIRTSLRMTKPLYDRLDAAASEKGVTMHSEILARLEASFSATDFDARAQRFLEQAERLLELSQAEQERRDREK